MAPHLGAAQRVLQSHGNRNVVPAALELSDVALRHPDGSGLGPVDLRVEEATTLVVLGPSGGGKTTLLRLLLGLLHPQRGIVRFGGEDLAKLDPLAVRRRVGYVVQGGGLFPHLTARGNVELMPRYLGWDPPRLAARLQALRDLVRLPAEALERFPRQLSGGQAQRVGLMRALVLDPDVLLFDEPLGALDPITRSDLQVDLRRAFAELRKTVVLVTHDLAEAAHFADKVVVLRDGRLAQEGTFEELVRAPKDPFVARFVGASRAVAP
ncbi:MAG: ATP-binding cassette domain-containing protein [Myxococcales bacterium]